MHSTSSMLISYVLRIMLGIVMTAVSKIVFVLVKLRGVSYTQAASSSHFSNQTS